MQAQGAPLKFWQFYAPGGQVKPQVAWFEKAVADWNATHDQKVELEFIPNKEYVNGPKLATPGRRCCEKIDVAINPAAVHYFHPASGVRR